MRLRIGSVEMCAAAMLASVTFLVMAAESSPPISEAGQWRQLANCRSERVGQFGRGLFDVAIRRSVDTDISSAEVLRVKSCMRAELPPLEFSILSDSSEIEVLGIPFVRPLDPVDIIVAQLNDDMDSYYEIYLESYNYTKVFSIRTAINIHFDDEDDDGVWEVVVFGPASIRCELNGTVRSVQAGRAEVLYLPLCK